MAAGGGSSENGALNAIICQVLDCPICGRGRGIWGGLCDMKIKQGQVEWRDLELSKGVCAGQDRMGRPSVHATGFEAINIRLCVWPSFLITFPHIVMRTDVWHINLISSHS